MVYQLKSLLLIVKAKRSKGFNINFEITMMIALISIFFIEDTLRNIYSRSCLFPIKAQTTPYKILVLMSLHVHMSAGIFGIVRPSKLGYYNNCYIL